VAVCGASAAAIERTRLPAFPLTTMDGQATSSEGLIRSGHWLVIYVQPECASCDALLKLVVRAEHPQIAPRTVIVESGAASETVRALAAAYPDLAESRWFGDASGAAAERLRLTGTPAIFGLNGESIEWALEGMLSSPDVKAVMANWVAGS
jgi:hypothetical protein